MEIPRPAPPRSAPEREMLEAWLDFHRMTLARKCHGLAPAQLRRRAVPPSALSLLGLVRHMGGVERNWFRRARGHEAAAPRGPAFGVVAARARAAHGRRRTELVSSRAGS